MNARLQVVDLGKKFNEALFSEVNLTIGSATKIGLIGDNGSGKSTLLKVLAGLDTADEGRVEWSRDTKIGYLEQEIQSDTFDVSGGEKKILRLTELFYGGYDALLLDEPDNHLDVDHKLWFEQLVSEFEGIVIVISHDRKFLTSGVTKIWLLTEKQVTEYPFAYDKFRSVYLGNMEHRQHTWEVQEKERKRLAEIVARFRVWAASNSKLTGRYHSAVKRYDKFVAEMVVKPPKEQHMAMSSDIGRQHARKTAVLLKGLHKSFGSNQVLNGIDLHLFCREKIAIAAPNGSGKSTLLNIIARRIDPDAGDMRIGEGLKCGYYVQEHLEALDDNSDMISELQKSSAFAHYDAVAYLKKFLFIESQLTLPIKRLSGGQKARLQLARFLATNPDILILDEPTNHLDLKTVEALENFLKDYAGALILVSHDLELVDAVAEKVYEVMRRL